MLKTSTFGVTSTRILIKFTTSKFHYVNHRKHKNASLLRKLLHGLTWSLLQTTRFTNPKSLIPKKLFWMISSWTGWILLLRLQLNLWAIFSKIQCLYLTVNSTCVLLKITTTFHSYLRHLSLCLNIWRNKGRSSNFKFKCLSIHCSRRGKCTTFWIGLETREAFRQPCGKSV